MDMKTIRAYLRYLITVLLLLNLVHLAYGYEYENAGDRMKAESQRKVKGLQSRIGNTYWILPNDSISFYEEPKIGAKSFYVTKTEGITITDWISTSKHSPEDLSYYKVIFESGEVAFLEASTFSATHSRVYGYGRFILTEDPNEAKIMRDKKKMDIQKMIAASIGDKLPPGYKGNNIKNIYERLQQKIPTKGQFEKTEEYEKRVQGVKINEVYAFSVEDELKIEYSPDNENLEVDIRLLHIQNDDDFTNYLKNKFISVKESSVKATSYVASNAFGAKTVVRKFSGIIYGVYAVNSLREDPYWVVPVFLNLDVGLKVAEAKKHMNSLKVLLIGVPRLYGDPLKFAFKGKYLAKPTFDDPVEFSYGVRGLNVEIVEIWLYNFKTGNIVKKWEFY